MSRGEDQIVASQNIPAAQALVVFQLLTANDEGRRAFKTAPEEAFNDYRDQLSEPLRSARYSDIPEKSRRALEALSIYEIALLSDLDGTFIADEMWVDVPGAGKLFVK
jgi:hypothetical protein